MAAGGDELRKVEGDLQGAGGFSADAAEQRLDNVAGAFTKVKSAMSGMAIDVSFLSDDQSTDYRFLDRLHNREPKHCSGRR